MKIRFKLLNAAIILLFISLLSSLSMALEYSVTLPALDGNAPGVSWEYCTMINASNLSISEMKILNVSKAAADSATKCKLLNGQGARETLADGDYIGDSCTLSPSVTLSNENNQTYLVCGYSPGAAWDFSYKSSTLPYDGGWVTFLEGFSNSTGAWVSNDAQANHVQGLYLISSSASTGTPSFSDPTPQDNAYNNTNQTINCSHDGSDIRFYLNVTIDGGTSMYYIFNETETGTGYKTFSTNFSDGEHLYSCYVQNITNGVFSEGTSRTLTIDTVSPTITILGNNFFSIVNNSRINPYLGNDIFNVSFYDLNLEGGQTIINITNSTTLESLFTIHNTSITGTTVNVSKELNLTKWGLGNKSVVLSAADAHTKTMISDYYNSIGIDNIIYLTEEGISIKIESLEEDEDIELLTTTKNIDRYRFGVTFKEKKSSVSFRLYSSSKLNYIKNSEYPAHFTTFNGHGGNWIDFREERYGKEHFTVKKINDFIYDITIDEVDSEVFSFNSVGGLNVVEEHYRFEVTSVVNISVIDDVTNKSINFTSMLDGVTLTSTNITNTTQHINISRGDYMITLTADGYDPRYVTVGINETYHNFTLSMTGINVLDDCSGYSNQILSFYMMDEENPSTNITSELYITLEHYTEDNISYIKNSSFSFTGDSRYDICTNEEDTFIIDAIIEYGDGDDWAIRKYYINNLSINITNTQSIYLYHLNYTKASDIVLSVFDSTTGDDIQRAYIEILRYYPGENLMRTVEICRTDEAGQTIGKMVLADVFYRFIIEKPAGVQKLDTGIMNILSTTRSFGISFIDDYLDTWDRINNVFTDISCTKDTNTCRLEWNDASNIVQDVRLEVWRNNGLAEKLLSSQTASASSGTLSYTVTEDTTGNRYVAKGFLESNTGYSTYGIGSDEFFYTDNPFFVDEDDRFASLFPLFLLVLVIVFSLIDFGAIGVTIGSILGLLVGYLIGILPISRYYLASFIILAAILIYKVNK